MKLKHVTLENFRGFKKLELTLDPQLTVLVGANGAGKSSVLDAIAILLSRITSRMQGGNGRRDGREQDIFNRAHFLRLKALVNDNFYWSVIKYRKTYQLPKQRVRNSLGFDHYLADLQEKIVATDEQCSIPLFTYYPINRAVLDIPLRIKKSHQFSLMAVVWNDALTSASNFRSFFEWFRELEDLENEINRYRNTSLIPEWHEIPALKVIRFALQEFLPEFSGLSIRRSPLRMVVKKQGQEVRVDQLSDGEKCLIALVADIARRLAIANPTLEDPLQGEGVVLIDEVDLHLHPAWQRMVLPKLTATFPNCQFIVSTHSPQILGEVDASQIRILSQDENNEIHCHIPQQAKGLTSNEVLNELMSWDGSNLARNTEVEEQLDTLFKLIDDEDFVQAKAKIAQMKTALHGSLPDIVQAEALMSMMEADLVDDTK